MENLYETFRPDVNAIDSRYDKFLGHSKLISCKDYFPTKDIKHHELFHIRSDDSRDYFILRLYDVQQKKCKTFNRTTFEYIVSL
jgi:hypothetical protein